MKKILFLIFLVCVPMNIIAMQKDDISEIADNNLKFITADNQIFYFPQDIIKFSFINNPSSIAASKLDPIYIEDLDSSDLKYLMPYLWQAIITEPQERKKVLYQMIKACYSSVAPPADRIQKLMVLANKIEFKELVEASAKFCADMMPHGKLRTNIQNWDLLKIIATYYFLNSQEKSIFFFPQNKSKVVFPTLSFAIILEEWGKDRIIGDIDKIKSIDLYNMRLSDLKGLETIEGIDKIKKLRMKKNFLSGELRELASLEHLELLFLTYNSFKKVPPAISSLHTLKELYLNRNKIIAVEDSLVNLINLKVLNIAENELTEFPLCPPDLEELNLARNLIMKIPNTIANLRKLKILYINQNHLSLIHKEIGSVSETLAKVDLKKNKLSKKTLEKVYAWLPKTIFISESPNDKYNL